jgi:hypothetical protein
MVEDVINRIDGKVQIIFEKGDAPQNFRDAIWMLQEEYDTISQETIEALKDDRYNNWLTIINTPPVELPEVVDESSESDVPADEASEENPVV